MPSPTWQAATTGQPGLAGAVNQLLTTHAVTYVYAGALAASQSTGSPGGAASNGLYVAQSFTTGSAQTTAGYVTVTVSFTGSPAPWGFSLQAGSAGAPSGTALASAWLPSDFTGATAEGVTVLLPATGLTSSSQYWIVAAAQGDSPDFFSWSKSNQTTGAATSPDGVTWTAQTYGLLYQVYDGTQQGVLTGIYEDGGARSTVYLYSGGLVAGIQEFTVGQTPAGYAASARSLTYSGGLLAKVA